MLFLANIKHKYSNIQTTVLLLDSNDINLLL